MAILSHNKILYVLSNCKELCLGIYIFWNTVLYFYISGRFIERFNNSLDARATYEYRIENW
jgi:hypothetical protein